MSCENLPVRSKSLGQTSDHGDTRSLPALNNSFTINKICHYTVFYADIFETFCEKQVSQTKYMQGDNLRKITKILSKENLSLRR